MKGNMKGAKKNNFIHRLKAGSIWGQGYGMPRSYFWPSPWPSEDFILPTFGFFHSIPRLPIGKRGRFWPHHGKTQVESV